MRKVKQQINIERINFPYSFLRWTEEISITIESIILQRYTNTDNEDRIAYQATNEYRKLKKWRDLYASLHVPNSQFYRSFENHTDNLREIFENYWKFIRNEIKVPESSITEVITNHENFRREAELLTAEHKEKIKQSCIQYLHQPNRKAKYLKS